MAAEIELKLSLPEQALDALRAHPLLRACQLHEPRQRPLYNRYFDTPDQALNRHAVALRIRRQEDEFIQTLKTRGSSQGGLHQRNEWEWQLPADRLDLSLIAAGSLPDAIDPQQLRAAFSTDFQRTTWLLEYSAAGAAARIELVLDEGWVKAGEQRDPIREVELELKGGAAAALIAFARELAATLPLRICRISKAERGYRLGCPERARQLPALPPLPPTASHPQPLYRLLATLTERLQCAMEGFEFLRDPELLLPLYDDLQQLVLLLEAYAAHLPDSENAAALPLATQLVSLSDQLRRLIAPLLVHRRWGGDGRLERHSARLETELNAWLNSIALGQALLDLSSLLYHRPWQPDADPAEGFFHATP